MNSRGFGVVVIGLLLSIPAHPRAQLRTLPLAGARPDVIELAEPNELRALIAAHLGKPVVVVRWRPDATGERALRALDDVRRSFGSPFGAVYLAVGTMPGELASTPPDVPLPKPWYCTQTFESVPGIFDDSYYYTVNLAFLDEKGARYAGVGGMRPLMQTGLERWEFETSYVHNGQPVTGRILGEPFKKVLQAWFAWHQPASNVGRLEKAVFAALLPRLDQGPPRIESLANLVPIRDLDGFAVSGPFRIPVRATGFVDFRGIARIDSIAVTGSVAWAVPARGSVR